MRKGRAKFIRGKVTVTLQENERKWLLSWVKSAKQVEKDALADYGDPKFKEYLWFAEKIEHLLMTGKIQNSKFSRQKQTSKCPVCGNNFVYLYRHSCKGKEIDRNDPIDWEAVARV